MALDLRPTPPEALPFLFEDRHRALAEVLRRLSVETLAPAEDAHARAEAAALTDVRPAPEPAGDRAQALARTLADAGVLGLAVPEAFGGVAVGRPDDLDVRSLCLAREHLAWASGLADTTFAMQGLGTYPITRFGTEAQKQAVLPDGGLGRAARRLRPHRGRGGLGRRRHGLPRHARTATAGASTGRRPSSPTPGSPGPTWSSPPPSRGTRRPPAPSWSSPATRASPSPSASSPPPTTRSGRCASTAAGSPRAASSGRSGQGLKIALSTLDVFRTTVAAAALGLARRALDEATHRALARRQFGRPLADRQQVQAYLAESAVELEAARLLTYRAAWHKDTVGGRVTRPSAMAKLFATEAAQRIVDRAVQLHGGTGVLRGVTVERLYREVRALRIYEGTSEIQRLVIAGDLLREAGEAGEPEPR